MTESNPQSDPNPQEQYNPLESLPTSLDEFLTRPDKLDKLIYHPIAFTEEQLGPQPAMHDKAVIQELDSHVRMLRDTAIQSLLLPEAVAQYTGLSHQKVAEEAVGYFIGSRNILSDFPNSRKKLEGGIDEVEQEIPKVRFHIQHLEDSLENNMMGAQMDEIDYDVYILANFDQFYSRGWRRINEATNGIEDSVLQARFQLNTSQEEAEKVRRRVVQYDQELAANPQLALDENITHQVTLREANTLESHQRSCDQDQQTALEGIANIRDDAQEISSELEKFTDQSMLKKALSEWPYTNQFYASVSELREALDYVRRGDLRPQALADRISEIKNQFETIVQRVEFMRHAVQIDDQAVNKIAGQITQALQAEYFSM